MTTSFFRSHLGVFSQPSTLAKGTALGAGVLLFLWLMLFRQPVYPAPWFDEGLNVSTAAMLAREGLYALPNSDGPRIMDPAIQTGPTVLVPVALVFHLFDIGIMQARITMLAFAVLALVAYALVARRLVGGAAMGLALLLLLVGNRQEYASFVYTGRQVLGEVPALGYYLLGLLIWFRAVEQPERRWAGLILSGLAWGIAMVTKSQILLLLPISLGLLMLLDRVYYRRVGILAFIVPGITMVGCVLVWYAAQMAIVGPERFQQSASVLREGFALHIVSINSFHWRNAVSVIWNTGWWLWGAPGILWGIWQARQRTSRGFNHAVALALPLMGLIWFTALSVGWGRYAFYPLVLTPIWTAGLLVDLWRGVLLPARRTERRIIVGSIIVLYLVFNGWPLTRNLIAPVDTGYLAMRDYLATQVPSDAVIESWEWEMSMDARQPIHHPPTPITNLITEYMWSRRDPVPSGLYDARQGQPQYILQGPFGAWTGLYHDVLSTEATPVASFGSYTLYALQP